MNRPLLDTHMWVWWMLGDDRLQAGERAVLDRLPAAQRPVLCAISLWELTTLVDLGRVVLDLELGRWLRIAAAPAAVALSPVTAEVVAEMNRLPATFHRDPADRLIVATARVLALPVATRDRRITRSRLVGIWRPD